MFVNIPNILSVTRILLTPLFVICLIRGLFYPAAVVFALAGISDALDGLFARWLNQRTVLGAYLDPIADKILLMSAFICLAVMKVIPPWVTVIVISRDIIIVVGFAISEITDTDIEIRPRLPSKCTTIAQMLTVFFYASLSEYSGDGCSENNALPDYGIVDCRIGSALYLSRNEYASGRGD